MTGPDDDEPRVSKAADLVSGAVFVGVGLWFTVLSVELPRPASWGITFYSAPGLVPGVLGLTLAVLGLALIWRARSALFETAVWRALSAALLGGATARALLALALTLGYPLLLVGRMPFWIATTVFVFLFVFAFETLAPDRRSGWLRLLAIAGAMGLGVGVAVVFVFEQLLLVRLP